MSWAHWPANLTKLVNSKPRRDYVSKQSITEDDQRSWPLHIYAYVPSQYTCKNKKEIVMEICLPGTYKAVALISSTEKGELEVKERRKKEKRNKYTLAY